MQKAFLGVAGELWREQHAQEAAPGGRETGLRPAGLTHASVSAAVLATVSGLSHPPTHTPNSQVSPAGKPSVCEDWI